MSQLSIVIYRCRQGTQQRVGLSQSVNGYIQLSTVLVLDLKILTVEICLSTGMSLFRQLGNQIACFDSQTASFVSKLVQIHLYWVFMFLKCFLLLDLLGFYLYLTPINRSD